MRKPSVLVIFLTVFIDLIGFGIVLPLLPIYAQDFGAKGWMIGAIVGSYSLMQFLFAPAWGRLSDRIGRRPVLLVSTAGAAISYALFAIGSGLAGFTALLVLLASRTFAGICGANITVAQAYIADITPREERSKTELSTKAEEAHRSTARQALWKRPGVHPAPSWLPAACRPEPPGADET